MSSDLQTRSIQYAIQSTGTNPELSRDVLDATVAPTAQGTGYDVGAALYGTVRLHMRRGGPSMVVDLQITTWDLTTGVTYTATVDGNAVIYTVPASPPADVAALVEAIRDAINGDATVGALVTATAIDRTATGDAGGTSFDTVRLTWDTPTASSLVWAISGTTARATVYADPEDARLRVYGAWATASVSTRLAAEYDDLERSRAWEILRGADGTAADVTVADGLGYAQPIYVAELASVRPYLTGIGNALITTTTATTIPTITIQDPLVIVTFGRVAS